MQTIRKGLLSEVEVGLLSGVEVGLLSEVEANFCARSPLLLVKNTNNGDAKRPTELDSTSLSSCRRDCGSGSAMRVRPVEDL